MNQLRKISPIFFSFGKVLLAFILIYFLIKKNFLSFQLTCDAFENTAPMLAAFSLSILAFFVGAYRWNILLELRGIRLPPTQVLRMSFIGAFFNLGLPGSISGDFFKAAQIGKAFPERKYSAYAGVLMDRILGLSGLVCLATFAIATNRSIVVAHPQLQLLRLTIYALFAAMTIFYTFIFNESVVSKITNDLAFQPFYSKYPLIHGIFKTFQSLAIFRAVRIQLIYPFILSLLIHVLVVCANIFFLHAIEPDIAQYGGLFFVIPLAILTTTIPLTPMSIGTGHVAFWFLFHLLGITRGADIYTLRTFFNLTLGLIGSVLFSLQTLRSCNRTKAGLVSSSS